MNTPSKEALDASEAVQDYLGFPRRATIDLAAIIDRHFEQLRRDNATLAGRLTAAELERDDLGARAEQGVACDFAVRLMKEKQEKHPDAERIDWLESQPSKYNWGVTLDHGCVFAVRNTTSGYSTLREAIDAARKP